MADNETIADIIAEMRGMGNYQRYSGDHARVLANRLDAAHRRERGDCAKLREALEQVSELNDLWFDTFTLPDGATSIHDEIEDVISAALAATPRNCDRPECATTKAAQDVWRKEDGGKTAYYEWLLATHKKGGAK